MQDDGLWETEEAEWETLTPESEFLCDDGAVLTWAQMTEGMDADLLPTAEGISHDEQVQRYHDFLWSFGASRIS
jgi:hypothetical protein